MCRFLVVDDEEGIRDVFSELLFEIGYKTYVASDAVEAMKIIRAVNEIRAVFTDLHLPGVDGLTLTRKIRKVDPLIYICAITGHADLFSIIESREAGADDFLVKPIDLKDLTRIANDIYNRIMRWNSYRD